MFGIGTGEMLVLGVILWLLLKGKPGAPLTVLAGFGLLILLTCAGIGIVVSIVDSQMHSPSSSPTWSVALGPMLIVIAAFLVLLAVAAHKGLGHAFAGGHGHIWPVFLVVPIVGFLIFGGIRYRSASQSHALQQRTSQRLELAKRQQREETVSVEQLSAYREELIERSKKLASELAEVAKATAAAQRIDQADIHQLMDEYEAPRIVLQIPMGPSAAPTALLMAAASAAKESAAKEPAAALNNGDTATKTNNKKEAKTKSIVLKGSAGDGKHPAAVEMKMESSADGKPGDMSIAVESEAPQPPAAPVPPVPPVPPVVAAGPAEELKPAVKVAPARLVKTGNAPPAWINDPPKRTGDVRREVVATDPFATDDECYHAGDVALMFKVGERIEQLSGQHLFDAKLPLVAQEYDHSFRLNAMGITPEFLRRELVAKDPGSNESREYLEAVTSSVGPMKKLYMQIEFSPAIDRELMQFAEAFSRQERFAAVGFGAGSVLTLLTMVWGLLKIDTATKGYYTKRLFLGVPAAIIAGIIAVITWMNYRL